MDFKLAYALLNLMMRTLLHYAKKLVPLGPRYDKKRFVDQYVHEGLAPLPLAARAQWSAAGQCTVCAQCDAVCPLLDTPGSFAGPMQVVVSGLRAAPHFGDASADLAVLAGPDCGTCRRCVDACPEDIPIIALAQMAMDLEAVHVDARARHTEGQ